MKKLAFTIATLFSATAFASGGQWGYDGHTGPEHWGELDAKFAACSQGKNQSPINIDGLAFVVRASALQKR